MHHLFNNIYIGCIYKSIQNINISNKEDFFYFPIQICHLEEGFLQPPQCLVFYSTNPKISPMNSVLYSSFLVTPDGIFLDNQICCSDSQRLRPDQLYLVKTGIFIEWKSNYSKYAVLVFTCRRIGSHGMPLEIYAGISYQQFTSETWKWGIFH